MSELLQEFATTAELLAHCSCPALTENRIRREADKVFSDWVENPAIKSG